MENSVEPQICTVEINDCQTVKNERVNGDCEPLREIGNCEIFATIEKLKTETCVTETGSLKTNNDGAKSEKEQSQKNMESGEQNSTDSQEVELSPPEDITLEGYSVTPVGADTSYKGVPSAQILEDLHSEKPARTECSEPKTRKKQPRSKQQYKQKSGRIGSTEENPKDDDKSSFTRKLQQFLSSSINIFSPQSKTKTSNTEVESNIEDSSTCYSSKAKKCLMHPADSSQTIVDDEDPKTTESSKGMETSITDDKTYSEDVEQNVESRSVPVSEDIISSEGSKTTLGALKEFLGVGSPKRTPNSTKINCQKDSLDSNEAQDLDKPRTSNNRNNAMKSYSRRELMKLSSLPSCNKVPDFGECTDESVKKDLNCGSTVKSKYLPINIVSREFKLKYRL